MKVTHPTRGAFSRSTLSLAVAGVLMSSMTQTAVAQSEPMMEEVTVVGIRASLERAMDIKREASGVVDSISAEDLGKFPDLNVAESLQRITGVAIDRSGGEGQKVTVRGLGPEFNMVTVNGRQLANDSDGREFNFDVISADQIKGADVFKSTNAAFQEGGIGATINLTTARPLDKPGLTVVGSVKGMYETLSEEIAPSMSLMVSNTFADDKVGVLLAYSRQERDVQINRIETAGWRPNQEISYKDSNGDKQVLFDNAYIPRNWDQIVDEQERTRDNLSAVLQFAPNDDVTVTLDGFQSKFEVDSVVTDLASWFEPDRVTEATISDNGTLTSFNQQVGAAVSSGDPASDFVSHTRNGRDVSTSGMGLNVEWAISDQLVMDFDYSTSSAENDRAGQDRFNVVGIINNYEFDGTGSTPTVRHDDFTQGGLPDASRARLHYNEKGNTRSDEDEITETKIDFEYSMDGLVETLKFGLYNQEREKKSFQIFGNQCEFCGYGTAAPLDVIGFTPYIAENFFPGLIDRFYTYDGDAYVQYLADQGFPIVPTLQANRYNVQEDITAAYFDVTLKADLGSMPLTVNFGSRYSTTDVTSSGVQSDIADVVPTTDVTLFSNVYAPEEAISLNSDYSTFLSSLNTKLELTDDMVVRFSAYQSMTRPTLANMSPSTTFGEPRRQNLTASGGNPALDPFTAMNYDLSFEWYYGDASSMSAALFQKEVDDFIVTLTGQETFVLSNRSAADGFRCNDSTADEPLCPVDSSYNTTTDGDRVGTTEELNGESEVYTVSRPRNGDSATIDGMELAITHVFDFGLGISANATFVDSNASLGADTSESFAFEGLGDSQNIVVFYEQDNYQARIAYNNREGFLRFADNGFNGEPVNTDDFGQWDISGSFDINENVTVFFEGINITKEELRQTGRFADQVYNIEDNGSRYAVGVRASF